MFQLIKFALLVVASAVVMLFLYTYPIDGKTAYHRGYELVMGYPPPLDNITQKDQDELNKLVRRTAKR